MTTTPIRFDFHFNQPYEVKKRFLRLIMDNKEVITQNRYIKAEERLQEWRDKYPEVDDQWLLFFLLVCMVEE